MFPGSAYHGYSYTQIIIDSAELAQAGANLFEHFQIYASKVLAGYMDNITIFAANTSKQAFTSNTDWVLVDNTFDTVFTGSLDPTEVGWNTFSFTNPVQWDGHSNIVLACLRDNNGEYCTSGYQPYWRYSTTTSYKSIYYNSDNNYVNPATGRLSGSSSSSLASGYASYNRTQINLITCGNSCAMPLVTALNHTETTVTINFSATNAVEVVITDGVWDSEATGTVLAAGTNTYTFTGLTPATDYTIGLRQQCDDQTVSSWNIVTVSTDTLWCATPENLSVVANTIDGAVIDWTTIGIETQWEVNVFRAGTDLTLTATSHPFVVSGLLAGTQYSVSVRALCGSDLSEGPWSDTLQFTTDICQPVTNVTVSQITDSSAQVRWMNSTSTNINKWIVEYGYTGYAQGDHIASDTVSTNPFTLTGLEEQMTYDVFVRVFCTESVTSTLNDNSKATFTTLEHQGIDGVQTGVVALYPNPASTSVTVELGHAMEATVSVIDMNGREVMRAEATAGRVTLDVSRLAQGAYFVRATGADVNAISKLVVR